MSRLLYPLGNQKDTATATIQVALAILLMFTSLSFVISGKKEGGGDLKPGDSFLGLRQP